MRIHNEITRIERSHDNLWSIREDLHAKFGDKIKAHMIDGVLNAEAAGHEGVIGRFRKIFIEKRATAELEAMALSGAVYTVPNALAAYGFSAA